ncbi:MAG: hypothetical protein KDK97_15755 [Verrucomicrobiales bacterium]|nr:hypothetical protein [Verrucomicrobiales bacterium]MCP5557980.1 hypothetical protein [Verrucomicrobiaceae bacterium]
MKFILHSIALLGLVASTGSVLGDVAPPPSRFEKQSGNAIVQVPEESAPQPEARKEADFLESVKAGVQITELGCMRAAFAFDPNAAEFETRVTEAFSDADFRVFSKGTVFEERPEPAALQKIGAERYADLIIYTRVSGREKPALGRQKLVEAEATVQVYNPLSEELLVSQTVRKDGERNVDEVVAVRTAFESAIDEAIKGAIIKTLEKAHKILVHEAQLKGVEDHQHLLEIMEYTAKLKGVYHVRQISYDKSTGLAVIEIIGAPQTESFWRAYLEKLPRRENWIIDVKHIKIVPNKALRQKNPDWMSSDK